MNLLVRFAGFFAVLVVVGGTACQAIVGIEDDPPTQLAPPSDAHPCAATFATGTCADCMTRACCAESTRCSDEPGCRSFEACLATCDPVDAAVAATCAARCRDQFPDGLGGGAAVVDGCRASHCTSECHVVCGGYPFPEPACGACAVDQCCGPAADCMSDPDCVALAACERGCALDDAGCLQRCELDRPRGVAKQRALGTCLTDPEKCASACVAPRWACLVSPHTSLPPPEPDFAATYRLIDAQALQRANNGALRVQAFTKSGSAVGAAVPTDGSGEASLTLAGTFDGFVEATGVGYTTMDVFLPPLTKSFTGVFPVVKTDYFSGLKGAVVGLDPDGGQPYPDPPGTATVLVNVVDCFGNDAAGVSLSIDSTFAKSFYFVQGFPSANATMTDLSRDIGAYGGFLGVPWGTVNVTAHVTENNLSFKGVLLLRKEADYALVRLYASGSAYR